MRIKFRQGLVSSKVSTLGQPDYLTTNPQGIQLHGAETPLVFSLADGTKNYTITINATLLAWPVALFNDVTEAWLYVDVNKANANITYGITKAEPAYGPVAPASPIEGALWYNTTRNEQNVFNSSVNRWYPTLRVIAGHFTSTTLDEVPTGTQVGVIASSAITGQIVWDGLGKALVDSSGRFFTTEDVVLIAGVESHAAKLESNVITGSAAEPIPSFHVVRFNSTGDIELADYDDTGSSVIGMSIVSGTAGNPINIVLSGLVHNEDWAWTGPNLTLWVNQTGQLTHVDPYEGGGRAKRRVPVGRTIDAHTIIFDQGMGGVGEKGETGSVDGIPIASDTTLGILTVSVPPEDAMNPIAVGDNDPRLTDPRVPLEHTHPATAITVSPFGTFNGTNAQQAFEHLQNVKLNLSGGTVTGAVVSTVTATQDNHLVTLGQAKAEITARAVTEKRFTLDDGAVTIVQAFNALSVANRTLAVNTVVVVEWRGSVYMFAGGYGSPVSATDSAQFLLIGKLTAETPPLTFRTIEAVTLYVAEDPVTPTSLRLLIQVGESSLEEPEYMAYFDCTTGEITQMDADVTVSRSLQLIDGGDRIALGMRGIDNGEILIMDANTGDVTNALPSYDGSLLFNTINSSSARTRTGDKFASIHSGGNSSNLCTAVTVFDSDTLSPVYNVRGFNGDGSLNNSETIDTKVAFTSTSNKLAYTQGYVENGLGDPIAPLFIVNLDNSDVEELGAGRYIDIGITADDRAIVAAQIAVGGNGTEFYELDLTEILPENLIGIDPAVTIPSYYTIVSLDAVSINGSLYGIVIAFNNSNSNQECIRLDMQTGAYDILINSGAGAVWYAAIAEDDSSTFIALESTEGNVSDGIWELDVPTWTVKTQYGWLPNQRYFNNMTIA